MNKESVLSELERMIAQSGSEITRITTFMISIMVKEVYPKSRISFQMDKENCQVRLNGQTCYVPLRYLTEDAISFAAGYQTKGRIITRPKGTNLSMTVLRMFASEITELFDGDLRMTPNVTLTPLCDNPCVLDDSWHNEVDELMHVAMRGVDDYNPLTLLHNTLVKMLSFEDDDAQILIHSTELTVYSHLCWTRGILNDLQSEAFVLTASKLSEINAKDIIAITIERYKRLNKYPDSVGRDSDIEHIIRVLKLSVQSRRSEMKRLAAKQIKSIVERNGGIPSILRSMIEGCGDPNCKNCNE